VHTRRCGNEAPGVEVPSMRMGSRATDCALGLACGTVPGRSLGLVNHDRNFEFAQGSELANGGHKPEMVRILKLANGCRTADAARTRLLLRRRLRWLERGRFHDTRPVPDHSICPAVQGYCGGHWAERCWRKHHFGIRPGTRRYLGLASFALETYQGLEISAVHQRQPHHLWSLPLRFRSDPIYPSRCCFASLGTLPPLHATFWRRSSSA
jgi:hypothetical protein